jgi:hypothetical protein
MQVIVFENDDLGVSIIVPALDSGLTIEEIAEKDVPPVAVYEDGGFDDDEVIALRQEYARPYWIIDDSELPDRAERDRWIIVNAQVLIDPNKPNPPALPNPKGFYEKLIGVHGDYPLFQVYQSITFQALDNTKDTSSLSYAVTVFNNALNINDWSQDYAKSAYTQAYSILKPFLSTGQISIIDAENIVFNLI